MKICVAGATGWVGVPLCKAISDAEDLELVGAVSRSGAGRSLSEVAGVPGLELRVSGSVEEALATPTDVLVEYTSAAAVRENTLTAIRAGVSVVVGSSGLTDEDFDEIHDAAIANDVGVIAAGNFAITAVLLQRFACEAAKYLDSWEVIDYASAKKIDAPSGTARELAYRLSLVGQPRLRVPLEDTRGERDSRGTTLNGTQVHSIRVPGFVISVEAIFGAEDERLSIRHDSGSGAGPYIGGTLLAIRKVKEIKGLVRGLDRVMD